MSNFPFWNSNSLIGLVNETLQVTDNLNIINRFELTKIIFYVVYCKNEYFTDDENKKNIESLKKNMNYVENIIDFKTNKKYDCIYISKSRYLTQIFNHYVMYNTIFDIINY